MVIPNSTLPALFAAPVNPGQVVWIGLRPARRDPVITVKSVIAEAGIGLNGDRYNTSTNGPRQVTIIQMEYLQAIASYLRQNLIDPGLLRRNIVVKGINLLALKGKQFQIGEVLLGHSGKCHP